MRCQNRLVKISKCFKSFGINLTKEYLLLNELLWEKMLGAKKRNPIKLPSLILSDMLRNSLGQAMHLWRDPKFDNVFNLLLPSKKQILSRAIDLQRIQLVLMFWEITTGHATNEQAKSILLLSNIGVHKGRGGVYIATPNLFFCTPPSIPSAQRPLRSALNNY